MDDGVRNVPYGDSMLFGKGQWDTQLQSMGKRKQAAERRIRGVSICSSNLWRAYNFMLNSLVVESDMGSFVGSMISARRNGRVYKFARGGVAQTNS